MGEQTTNDTVKCAKCGRRNPKAEIACAHCSAHLYIECPHCAHRSERRRRSCDACGERLRSGALKKLKRWVFNRSRKHVIILTLVALVLVGLLCLGVFAIAEMEWYKLGEPTR